MGHYSIQIREPYEIKIKNFLFYDWIFRKIEKCALLIKNLKFFFTVNKISRDSSYIFLKTFV